MRHEHNLWAFKYCYHFSVWDSTKWWLTELKTEPRYTGPFLWKHTNQNVGCHWGANRHACYTSNEVMSEPKQRIQAITWIVRPETQELSWIIQMISPVQQIHFDLRQYACLRAFLQTWVIDVCRNLWSQCKNMQQPSKDTTSQPSI